MQVAGALCNDVQRGPADQRETVCNGLHTRAG